MSLLSHVCSLRFGIFGRQGRSSAVAFATLRSAIAMAAVTLGAAVAAASAPIVIDDFAGATTSSEYRSNAAGNYTFYAADATVPSGYVATEISSGAIGGSRVMDLNVIGTPSPTSLALTVGYLAQTGANELNVATNGATKSAGVVTLNYSILSGVNLAAGGMNQDMVFQMAGNDSTNLDIDVKLTSGGAGGPTATLDKVVGTTVLAPSTTNVDLPLADFVSQAGFNMRDVTGISIVFNGQSLLPSADWRVQSITVPVPEPSSIALLASAAVLVGGYLLCVRRRRNLVAAVA